MTAATQNTAALLSQESCFFLFRSFFILLLSFTLPDLHFVS